MSMFPESFSTVVPATGATIPVPNTSDYIHNLTVDPAGGLAALTINFSVADQIPVGAIRRFYFRKAIVLLGFTAGPTVLGAIVSPLLGSVQTFKLFPSGEWVRIS